MTKTATNSPNKPRRIKPVVFKSRTEIQEAEQALIGSGGNNVIRPSLLSSDSEANAISRISPSGGWTNSIPSAEREWTNAKCHHSEREGGITTMCSRFFFFKQKTAY